VAVEAWHWVATHGLGGGPAAAHPAGGLEVARNAFDLRAPHFLDALVSCQHGAFYWAPVLALATAGLLWAAWRNGFARVMLLAFLANVYLVGALVGGDSGDFNWSGGNSFGMRYLAECAPFLAMGLAVLVQGTAARLREGFWRAAVVLLVAANGGLVLAYGLGTIDRERCVTHREMVAGVAAAVSELAGRGAR
jgi:hypothetical protein